MAHLREEVYRANMAIQEAGLVLFTFGNVSGADRERGVMYIKPSGVPYKDLSPDNMVEVDLATGAVAEGGLNPSSDTPTHLELYRAFAACGGIVHTHSEFATAFAQAGRPVRCTGTTHADYFRGDIPVTRSLTREEVEGDYEARTGTVIAETFTAADPEEIPAVLVANHGPFVWGANAADAAHNAVIVEYLARMQYRVDRMDPAAPDLAPWQRDKHFMRKHGSGAYYGQAGPSEKG